MRPRWAWATDVASASQSSAKENDPRGLPRCPPAEAWCFCDITGPQGHDPPHTVLKGQPARPHNACIRKNNSHFLQITFPTLAATSKFSLYIHISSQSIDYSLTDYKKKSHVGPCYYFHPCPLVHTLRNSGFPPYYLFNPSLIWRAQLVITNKQTVKVIKVKRKIRKGGGQVGVPEGWGVSLS